MKIEKENFPEEEDAEVEEEDLAVAENAVAGETSTAAKTEIRGRHRNFIHIELYQIDIHKRLLKRSII